MVTTTEKQNIHVKRGDTVIVISGKDKGKVGNVKEVFTKKGTIIVEGVNMVTKAVKSDLRRGVQGGLTPQENPIESSKVMLYCVKCEKPTRIRHASLEDGAKTRVCMRCREHLDIN
jgi:large subunit ribosomal protein L24